MKGMSRIALVAIVTTAISIPALAGRIDEELQAVLDNAAPDQVVSSLVYLTDRVDIEAIWAEHDQLGASRQVRHEVIVRALQERAASTQGDLLAYLGDRRAAGTVSEVETYWIVSHADEDELFIVLEGRFRMDYRDSQKWLEKGDMVIVPKGVEHKPYAKEECSVLTIERGTVINTGNAEDTRRIDVLERI